MSYQLIFFLNTFSSFFLMGVIWCVQLVHYPSFRYTDEENFPLFHRQHSLRIGLIVAPVMLLELITSTLLFLTEHWFSFNSIGFYLVLLIWISTALLSVPLHSKLRKEKKSSLINRLVYTNWVRTLLWTAKSAINFWVLLTIL
ncbi:MAG: hypothetical protein FH748_06760 [Balneolaceae bacterium]|nr:hypothetical protein [Balneolaceae bacterium]